MSNPYEKIAFYYQQKKFSCGPAALRMAIETLIKQDVDEDILIELSGAKEEIGTHFLTFEKNMATLLAKICLLHDIPNNFEFIMKQNSNIVELQGLQSQRFMIMLNYTTPDNRPHWSVLKKINTDTIILMDPEYGPDYPYQVSQFNWKGGQIENPTIQALIAIKYIQN